jgi:hypothetical protein
MPHSTLVASPVADAVIAHSEADSSRFWFRSDLSRNPSGRGVVVF